MKLKPKIFRCLVLALLWTAWASPATLHGAAAKAIVLAWDGSVASFVSELLGEGKLPNLARLIADGAFAADVVPVFPSKTAPGFASLMTGAPPHATGISGNRVPREPRADYTILDSIAGFSAAPLRAEPLWAAAQRAGKKVVISHIPSFGQEQSENAVRLHGYSTIFGRDGIVTPRSSKLQPAKSWSKPPASLAPLLEISFVVGVEAFFGLLLDDPLDPHTGYDTLLLARSRNGNEVEARLKAHPAGGAGELFWSHAVSVATGREDKVAAYFRLFELKDDGSDFFLYFTRPARSAVSPARVLESAPAILASFVGNGASIIYQHGGFGRTIANGGHGGAEARYLETVVFAQHQLMETNRWALAHLPWDVFLAYTPFPDESEHLWRGYLDPELPGYRREIADRLRPFLEQVYKTCDDHLGLFLENRPDDTLIALISDHGLQGVHKRVAINRVLQKGGLLATDEQGRVDLANTQVLYPPANNGYLLINSTDRKNGIVPGQARAEVVRKTGELLMELRDGERRVVTAVHDAEHHDPAMGIGGPVGGDIYVDLADGYDFDPRITAAAPIVAVEPYGTHGANPQKASMRTIMVFNGPGVAAGTRMHDVRIVDFAPTLAALLAVPAPKDSSGRVLGEALLEPR